MSKRDRRKQAGVSAMDMQETLSLQEADKSIYGGKDDLFGFPDNRSDNKELATFEDGSFQFGRFQITTLGFEMPDNVSIEEYRDLGALLFNMEGALQWSIGDWIVAAKAGEDSTYGTTYKEIMEQSDRSYSTVSKYKLVAERIEFFRRRKNLSYTHHSEIAQANISDKQRDKLLNDAEINNWTIKQLREAIADEQGKPPTLSGLPIELAKEASGKFMAKYIEKARKSDNRGAWIEYARILAKEWEAIADELISND